MKLITLFVVLMISLSSFAQQYHFIYIQADKQQPFYLKYGGKNYSSSSIGYLILPKLTDGNFTIAVGFPRDLYPEQTFNISVAGKDYGYALKNFDEKGWGLFNFQTTDIVMNVNAAAATEQVAKQITTMNNSNPFGNMLADAINDSTLNQQRTATDTVSKKAELPVAVAKDTSASSINKADVNSSNNTAVTSSPSVIQTDSLVTNHPSTDSTGAIVKSAQSTTNNGTDFTFLDNASKDTIHAFIPSADSVKTVATDSIGIEVKAAKADSAKGKIDNPFFSSNNNTTTVTQPAMLDTASNATGTTNSVVTNSNCKVMFSSYDADKLHKKIVSLHSQVDILAAIQKSIRDKCITTAEVKDLGNLFLSDEDRYNFYAAIYPHVSDYFNFTQLENQLIDATYKTRFKALLRQ